MQQMKPNDPQVVIWTKWDGLTTLAPGHIEYSAFDHSGHSGGSLATEFRPRSESYLMAVNFMASQAIYFADETPN